MGATKTTIKTSIPPSSTPPVHPSTVSQNGTISHLDTSDWLDDPLEAEGRPLGRYRVADMEEILENGYAVELYNGWIVWRPMADKFERTVLGNIQDMLSVPARKANWGQVLPDGTECVLDSGNEIIPDAALISWQRLDNDFTPHGPRDRPLLSKRPELVIESRSPSNTRTRDRLKRTKYFDNGTLIVWDVDEPNKCIHVYRVDEQENPTTYTINETIDCELLPGWARRLADIFDERVSAEAVVGEVADEWRKEGIATVAENMLRQGMDVALIAKATGLSENEINSIAKNQDGNG
ncbi:MAG: Uma2 family endonuclease [Chloroflexota bacterium]